MSLFLRLEADVVRLSLPEAKPVHSCRISYSQSLETISLAIREKVFIIIILSHRNAIDRNKLEYPF
jgi:hypothetical protein